jgi:hypothetical protein
LLARIERLSRSSRVQYLPNIEILNRLGRTRLVVAKVAIRNDQIRARTLGGKEHLGIHRGVDPIVSIDEANVLAFGSAQSGVACF